MAGLSLDPARIEHDLARLVLALMETLRELMELQALRHLEAGTLSPAEEERVGEALLRARIRIREMAEIFGVAEADLTLRLGDLLRGAQSVE
ncbi:MAG: gas vesicle protein K [Bacteroidota bacterium]